MVDRSWQRRGRKNSPTKDFEHSSRVPEITITVLNGSKTSQKRQPRPTGTKSDLPSNPPQNAGVQFLNYQPPKTGGRGRRNKKRQSFMSESNNTKEPSDGKQNSVLVPGGTGPADNSSSERFVLTASVPTSTSPVYTVIDPEVSAFEKFLAYCSSISPFLIRPS